MKKNYFLISLFAISIILSSCASKPVETDEDAGGISIKGQSPKNPNVVTIKVKEDSEEQIYGGEFYRFEFKGFKQSKKDSRDIKKKKSSKTNTDDNIKYKRFAIIEVLSKSGEQISLYSIGYDKKAFYDTFYISPNAAKVIVALSDSEYSYKTPKQIFEVQQSSVPVIIYPAKDEENEKVSDNVKPIKIPDVVAGKFNSFDFSAFNKYFDVKNKVEDKNVYGIIECYGEFGRLINRISYPTSRLVKTREILIPAKTQRIKIAVSGSQDSYYTPIDFINVKNNISPITVESFIGSSFRTLDLNIYQEKLTQPYGVIEYIDSHYKPIMRDSISNDGNGKLRGKVYIPRDAVWANLAFSNDQYGYSQTFDYIDILVSTNPSALTIPLSYFTSAKVKNGQMNEKISEFIKYLNIDIFSKDDAADLFIDYVSNVVEKYASNDFERVKLYHDAVLCTLTKFSEDEIKYKNQIAILTPLVEYGRYVVDGSSGTKKASNQFNEALSEAEKDFSKYSINFSPYNYSIEDEDSGKKKEKTDKEKYNDLVRLLNEAVKNYDRVMNEYQNPTGDYKQALKNRNRTNNSLAYAVLFRAFCQKNNIPCLVISGHQKKYDNYGNGWSLEDGIQQNHFWNIVLINNEAYLVDLTLDVQETEKIAKANLKKAKENRLTEYSDKWLFADPLEMIYVDYPVNSEFQLLKHPVSETEYMLHGQKKVEPPAAVLAPEFEEDDSEDFDDAEDLDETLSKKELKKREKQAKKEAKEKAKEKAAED